MPWNEESDGPWGSGEPDDKQRPPPRERRQKPSNEGPDIEDFVRRSQDRLKSVLPDGGFNLRTFGMLAILGLFALVVYQSAFVIAPDQTGIVTRFGAYHAPPRPPGLNFILWPIDQVQILRLTAANLEEIGYRSANEREGHRREVPDEALMLTRDENIVSVGFAVTWEIKPDAPQNYVFKVAAVRDTIRAVAESAMREVVGRNSASDIITRGQTILQGDVEKIMQETLDSYNAGVVITNVTISRPEVPPAVREAFNDVQQAAQDAQTFQNQARRDSNQVLADARADAAVQLQEADAYAKRVVAEAQGESARFVSIYNEYRNAKNVTQQRLYIEMMERVLGGANKVIMENGGKGVQPYLPLPALRSNETTGEVQK